jgi:regulator of cell morphogenesis and NO signaling
MQTQIEENVLNVTLLEPRQKHPAIFARFDDLQEGESLSIHNDHDPKPLYYQLLGERGNIFKWEYLEQGPEWWKVRISKNSNNADEQTLGQLAAKDLRKAEVFKKYGIDFCCGGKKTIKQACMEKGLDITKVEQELQLIDKTPGRPSLPYEEWSLDFLADYIVNTHHSYVRKSLPDIRGYAAKVARVHGERHPELAEIYQLIEEINCELTAHMLKEEKILFPYIKALGKPAEPQFAAFNTVQQPINLMEMEHELVGEHLAKIRSISKNYTLPEDACASYSLLYRKLEEFESDMHIHIHLENNILFPGALALEKK